MISTTAANSDSVYALTGGIACGKSTTAALLRERGWQIIDTDDLAHRLMEPGGENWQKIVDAFGPAILHSNQTIDRGSLGDLIFREPHLRGKLNSLTHPAIRKAWQQERDRFLEKANGLATGKKLIIVIPLLFEAELEHEFKTVICVGCSSALQRQWLRERGLNEVQIAQRLASQWPIEEKAHRSHRLIWNEGNLEILIRQIARLT